MQLSRDDLVCEKVPDSEEDRCSLTVSSGSEYNSSKQSLHEESSDDMSNIIGEANISKKSKVKKYRKREVPRTKERVTESDGDSPSDEPNKKRKLFTSNQLVSQ